eukprot:gb/GEZN01012573.1/.p1 GENE.gb/GEZN01012573.1/~~gb/GEZN01012573.1/.p1  ORF type:complete len:314 (-),score=37.62 gb/GEZN01012573.1/:19-960(-)
MRTLSIFCAVAFAVLLFSGPVEGKRKKRKVKSDVDPAVLCDVCQAATYYIHKDATHRPYSSKSGNWDIVLMETLQEHETCQGSHVEEASGKLSLDGRQYSAACEDLMGGGKFLTAVEEVLTNKGVAEGDVAKVCENIGVCTHLWPSGEHISKRESPAERNKRQGEEFLAKNKETEGVVVTSSGLQYKIIERGNSTKHPTLDTTCTVHYRGTLLNGVEFDSSYSRNEPAKFKPTQVIPGWTEGLQLMSPGDTFKFWIPWNIAYGARGSGGSIGPYSTLIFDLEMLTFEGAEDGKAAEEEQASTVASDSEIHAEL